MSRRRSSKEGEAVAKAFRPVLPGMLAATYARGGQTEEVPAFALPLPRCWTMHTAFIGISRSLLHVVQGRIVSVCLEPRQT